MGHPAETDRTTEGVAVGARADATDQHAVAPDGLGMIEQRLGIVEQEHDETSRERAFALGRERLATDEPSALVHSHREAEPGFERRVLAPEIVAPRAIRLLHAKRVHRVIADV